MTLAFEIVPNTYALLEGCMTECEVRRGTMGNVNGLLFVNTGCHFRKLTEVAPGRFTDDIARKWSVISKAESRS